MIAEVLFVCFAFYVVYFLLSTLLQYSRKLPPGPFPLPLIGNLHLLSSKPHLDLTRLGDTYGPLYRLNMGWNLTVVINNHVIAREAMLRRGTAFAGRPPHYVGSKFSRNGKGIGFQTFTPAFRRQQKTIFRTIKHFENHNNNGSTADSLQGLITTEVDKLCSRLGKQQGKAINPRGCITFALGNVVGALAFGKRYEEGDSEFWQLMDALTIFVEGLSSTSFIDTFPVLKYIPFSIIERVRQAVKMRDEVLDRKYREHKTELDLDFDLPVKDLTHALIKEAEKSRGTSLGNPAAVLSEDHVVMTMNDTIMAGSETPTMTLLWVIFCLVKYPDVQARLHAELDDVIGREAPPTWDDRSRLPYVEAFIAEVLRSTGVMPLAIPHHAIEDSSLAGYHIPKGTTVLLNIWAIHHDPQYWEAPAEFRPERFLDKDGYFSTIGAPGFSPYGIGLRSCPGEQLARMETFIFTARLLHALKFRVGEGESLPDLLDAEFGITLRPAPFKVCVSKRQ